MVAMVMGSVVSSGVAVVSSVTGRGELHKSAKQHTNPSVIPQ